MPTGLDICVDSARELGIVNAADVLSGDDAAYILTKLNRLLDRWNADRRAVYADVVSTFTLTPNLSPHTIGPTGATFTLSPNRPVSLVGCNIVDTSVSPDTVISFLNLRDRNWWINQPIKALTSAVPTDLYYEPSWPNGSLYIWPVPTVAYGFELMSRVQLSATTLVATFTLPPGYQDAITLTLAEEIAGAFQVQPSGLLIRNAATARAQVFANNDVAPRIRTQDAGMPSGGSGRRGDFDWMSRQIV